MLCSKSKDLKNVCLKLLFCSFFSFSFLSSRLSSSKNCLWTFVHKPLLHLFSGSQSSNYIFLHILSIQFITCHLHNTLSVQVFLTAFMYCTLSVVYREKEVHELYWMAGTQVRLRKGKYSPNFYYHSWLLAEWDCCNRQCWEGWEGRCNNIYRGSSGGSKSCPSANSEFR